MDFTTDPVFGSYSGACTGIAASSFVRDASPSVLFQLPGLDELFALSDAFEAGSEPNWDGYGAKAASPDALVHAFNVLFALPASVNRPTDFAVDVDGDIAFDWYVEPRRNFTLRIAQDGTLNWAGIIDDLSTSGSQQFKGRLPSEARTTVEKVVAGP